MHAVRQSFRPKHQVLVLKCYPRFQKNVPEVKPNSSELSYLLYYVTSRRSKVQKVGLFLEKKTENDVSRGHIGQVQQNVQVTLGIVRALIEKSSRDLPLYSPYVMRILRSVLRAGDINMAEESLAVFRVFCEHQDVATLVSDLEQSRQYDEIVALYASFVEEQQPTTARSSKPMSAPLAVRWKSVGLQAIECMCGTNMIGGSGGRQIHTIMPMILRTLHTDKPDHLESLRARMETSEKSQKEFAARRTMSITTVRTSETLPERSASPANVPATTADADRLAEEEIGLLALQSLKAIFVSTNRLRVRLATGAMLTFMCERPPTTRPETATSSRSRRLGTWQTAMVEMVTRWTPVQDRFVILLTMMETLVRSSTAEEHIEQQLVLATLANCLLSSNINMIGLSVMDILLGLIQHILLLLRLGGTGSGMLPHHQHTDAIDLFKISDSASAQSASNSQEVDISVELSTPSTGRQELLALLQKCIGSLATHVYYSDQVSDMITAILVRLKPSPTSSVPNTVAAIQHPAAAAQAISDSVHLREDSNADDFFSFGTAQVTALNAIKDVLRVANRTRSNGGAGAVGRNRVPIQVWEGTQWLLRDGDRRVRRTYVDTFLAWLDLEGRQDDDRVPEHLLANAKRSQPERSHSLNRRALSSASPRGKAPKVVKSSFFQLLYLAVYENALEDPDSAADILMLHLLLSQLVAQLGVNAVKSALPMIMRLQDDIFDDSRAQAPLEKVYVGSLVHGYLWCISKHFELEHTMADFEIQSEISNRRKQGLWLDAIQLPPVGINEVGTAAVSAANGISLANLDRGSLNRFQGLATLIDQVAQTYANAIASPPNSPPSSPGRVFSMPAISSTGLTTKSRHELPTSYTEEMASNWSREACISAADRAHSRATSLHGSRSGTHRSGNHGLLSANGHTPRDSSPASAHQAAPPLAIPHRSTKELTLLSSPPSQPGRFGAHETSPSTPGSSSDHQQTLRFDDLKRVLSGGAAAGGALAGVFSQRNSSTVRASSPLRSNSIAMQDFGGIPGARSHGTTVSAGSDSYVDAEGFASASEGDVDHPLPPPQSPPDISDVHHPLHRPASQRTVDGGSPKDETRSSSGEMGRPKLHLRPRSSSTASAEDPDANARALKGATLLPPSRGGVDDDVPPVPPLPKSLSMRNNANVGKRTAGASGPAGWDSRPMTAPDSAQKIALGISSVGRMDLEDTRRMIDEGKESDRRIMVQDLLNGIQVGSMGSGHGVGKPPY